ncbi:MAG TPA: glycine cleavage T C-terminal barrel domain-containing protein, partial [Kiritimatiellia bacterium]|nr:glycine cleavage T C-terminal barrel domain-containing protein [Kiritimatiellia bacterium]
LQRPAAEIREKLVKLKLLGRGVPRHGCAVWQGDQAVGTLTSATFAPSLGVGIGLSYLPVALAGGGGRVEMEIHGKRVPAEVVEAFRPG